MSVVASCTWLTVIRRSPTTAAEPHWDEHPVTATATKAATGTRARAARAARLGVTRRSYYLHLRLTRTAPGRTPRLGRPNRQHRVDHVAGPAQHLGVAQRLAADPG